MIFGYQARTTDGHQRTGTIDAPSAESAVQALQRQNLVVVSLKSAAEGRSILDRFAARFHFIKQRDVALLARQLSTLFDAKVPVIRTFQTVIGESAANPLRVHLSGVLDDVQGGTSMSQAMAKHPQVFSAFFVSMVHAGEESGKLDEVFAFLADYLERSYQTTTKVRNALIYPAFIFLAFIGVMVFMLTNVIPKVSAIIVESGQALPIYTRIIIGVSNFFTNFGVLILLFVIALLFFLWRYLKTSDGIRLKARVEISIPVIGNLYKKLYLSRIADNLQTLVAGGIPIVRSLEITSDVVGNVIYRDIVLEAVEAVRGGSTIAEAFSKHPEVPALLTQMMRVGEETGKLDQILKAVARFYTQEVNSLVDNLVSLIEPVLILVLGIGVGVVVLGVLGPLYSLSEAFG